MKYFDCCRMKTLHVALLFLASYTLASALTDEENDAVILHREERALAYWGANKPAENPGCPPGNYEIEELDENGRVIGFTCHQCPVGQFTKIAGHFNACVPCEFDYQSTPPGYNEKCFTLCYPGQGWNATAMKCETCVSGTFKSGANFDECQVCPLFHDSVRKANSCYLECPKGFEPTEDSSTCTPCRVGDVKTVVGNTMCEACCVMPCGKNWTYIIGARRKAECVRMTKAVEVCYPVLVSALDAAAPYIWEDETKKTLLTLEEALCHDGCSLEPTRRGGTNSGADLEQMLSAFLVCKDQTVMVGVDNPMPAIPKLRINDTYELDLAEVFAAGVVPDCPEEPTTMADIVSVSGHSGGGGTTPATATTSSTATTTSTTATTATITTPFTVTDPPLTSTTPP